VVLRKKAVMDPLNNAAIQANLITKYHNIFNSTVNIFSRNNYAATGEYEYVDENKLSQTIRFSNIYVDTTFQTIAKGTIAADDKFMLSPAFEFNGEVRLTANRQLLTYNGETRIIHDCPDLARNRMNFETEIDPNSIFIPISGSMMNAEGQPIGAGVVMNKDSIALYSTFLSLKRDAGHLDVAAAEGFLTFNKKAQEYQISNKDKLKEITLPGNFISLNVQSCIIGAAGRLSFACNTGLVKTDPIGKLTQDMSNGTTSMQATLGLDFLFSEQASKRMAEQINKYPDVDPVDISKTQYESSLR